MYWDDESSEHKPFGCTLRVNGENGFNSVVARFVDICYIADWRHGMDRDKNKPGDQSTTQAERFARMAEELECDQDEAASKAKLAVIAKAKPKDAKQPLIDKNKQK